MAVNLQPLSPRSKPPVPPLMSPTCRCSRIGFNSGGISSRSRSANDQATSCGSRIEEQNSEPKSLWGAPMSDVLSTVLEELNAGRLRVVDLTQPLSPQTPLLPLPPQFNNTPAFRIWALSRYDERGPAWYWNGFET